MGSTLYRHEFHVDETLMYPKK